MIWVRVDTDLYRHRRFTDLPRQHPRAVVAWLGGLLLAGEQESDGFVPTSLLTDARARPSDVSALVVRGLWVPVTGGYQIRDWADYQPTSATAEAARERGRKAARARWDRRDGEPGDAKRNA